MKGDRKVIEFLNGVLRNELSAINQYFLHSRMYKDMGLTELADHEHAESVDEMKHADQLIDFRKPRQQLLFIPLGQAAGHNNRSQPPLPLQCDHLPDHPARFLPGVAEEPTRIDHHKIGPRRLRNHPIGDRSYGAYVGYGFGFSAECGASCHHLDQQ